MVATEKRNAWRALEGGVVAGLVSGVVVALLSLLTTLLRGQDLWPAFKGAGAPFLGERAFAPGFDAMAVLVGVASHFAVSVGWGIVFGLLCFGYARGTTVLLGIPFGLLVWLVMYYVVLPLVGLGEMARSMAPGFAALTHIVYGVVTAIAFLPFQRHVRRPIAAV